MRNAGRVVLGLVVALAAVAAGALGAESRPAAAVAWMRFDKVAAASEEYAGRRYLWLGRVEIHLTIDAAPRAGRASSAASSLSATCPNSAGRRVF